MRRRDDLVQAFSHEEAYIPHERTGHMVDITLEYSRPFRALKLWLGFRAHGAAAFRAGKQQRLAAVEETVAPYPRRYAIGDTTPARV